MPFSVLARLILLAFVMTPPFPFPSSCRMFSDLLLLNCSTLFDRFSTPNPATSVASCMKIGVNELELRNYMESGIDI